MDRVGPDEWSLDRCGGRMSELKYYELDRQPGESEGPPKVPKPFLDRVNAGQNVIGTSWVPDELDNFAKNTLDVASEAAHSVLAGPQQYKEVEQSARDFLVRNGMSETDAAVRANEIGKSAYRGEALQNILFALPTIAAAPAIGAYRTMVSKPLEEKTGFPAEATEGFTVALLAALGTGSHVISRLRAGPDGMLHEQNIGKLPEPQDFKNAQIVVTHGEVAPHVEAKLNQLWQDHGVHPAEVLAEAERDPVVKQQLLSTTGELPERFQLTEKQLSPDWQNWDSDAKGAITTRVLDLGRGRKEVIPAPEEVAGHLEEFGRQAGFKFQVGPAMPEGHWEIGPQFVRTEFQFPGGKRTQAIVFMPDNPDYQMRNWIGLGRSEVLYHEVGHALDYFVLNGGRDVSQNIPRGPLRDEMIAANKRFAPQLWAENPKYRSQSKEIMADSIAAWLSNPEIRKDMPLFTERYGARLAKYQAIVDRTLPKKIDGEWKPPPGSNKAEAGGGGRGGGGNGGFPPLSRGDDGMPPGRPGWFEFPGPEETKPDMAAIQESMLKDISIGEHTDKKSNWSFNQLYTDFVDRFFPIAREVKRTPEDVRPDKAIDDPYKRARLFAGVAGKADHFIEFGTFDWHTYDNTGKPLRAILDPVKDDMRGFAAFIAGMRDLELHKRGVPRALKSTDILDVARYVKENLGKYGETAKALIDYQNELSRYLRDSGVLNDKAYAEMLEANKLYVPFHRVIGEEDFANRLGMGGSMTPHNPIKPIEGSELRLIDPVESIIKNTYLLTAMAEKNAVGTKLIDMLLSAKGKHPMEVTETPALPPPDANAVGQWLGHNGGPKMDNLRDVLAEAAHAPDRPGEISIFRNGVRRSYRVPDDIARSWKNLDAASADWITNLMRPFTNALRAGAVLNPEFMLRHTWRDFLYAFVTTTKGVFTPIDLVRGFTGLWKRDTDFQNWMKGGGGQVSMVALDRQWLQEKLADLTDKTGLFTRAYNVVIDPEATWLAKGKSVLGLPVQAVSKYVIHPLQVGTEFALSATHLAAYKKAARSIDKEMRSTITPSPTPNLPAPLEMGGLPAKREYTLAPGMSLKDALRVDSMGKQAIIEAAWQSRETSIDGQRIGAKMKAWNAISAFANAKVQDTDRIVRLLKDHPVSGMATLMAGITIPSVALWALNHDDSRYQALPEWEKDAFWIIMTDKWEPVDHNDVAALNAAAARPPDQVRLVDGVVHVNNGHIFRAPKPFGAGVVFGSLPERLLEKFVADNPHAFKGFGAALMEATVGDLMPNFVAPIWNQVANRTSFSNRTLIPAQLEKQLPEYQYLPYTTELAKKLGQVISAFPGMREASISEESGFMGGVAKALTSPVLIENYVREWTGGLGMYALQATDFAARKAGVLPEPIHAPGTLADIPVVKAFTVRYPSLNAQPIQDFYDGYQRNKKLLDTWKERVKEGDIVAMEKVAKIGGVQMFDNMELFHKAINEHVKLIREIDKNPTMKDYEKRQQIDGLYYAAIRMSQLGNKTLDALKE